MLTFRTVLLNVKKSSNLSIPSSSSILSTLSDRSKASMLWEYTQACQVEDLATLTGVMYFTHARVAQGGDLDAANTCSIPFGGIQHVNVTMRMLNTRFFDSLTILFTDLLVVNEVAHNDFHCHFLIAALPIVQCAEWRTLWIRLSCPRDSPRSHSTPLRHNHPMTPAARSRTTSPFMMSIPS